MTVSENEVNLEGPAPTRRRMVRKPRSQRVLSKLDVKAAADRAEQPARRFTKFKARPNWESEDFVGVGQDGVDRLKINDDKLLAIARDGWSLQWCTRAVRGQEMPQEMGKMQKGGWTPVYQSDFDGLLDGDFMPKGNETTPIIVDDAILCYRPTSLHMKAERQQRRDANEPLQIAEEQIGHGIPGVTGSTAPGVRNSIRKTVEQVDIRD